MKEANPYKGIYAILDIATQEILGKHEISSKEELDTLLKEVVLYNNDSPNKRQLIKI